MHLESARLWGKQCAQLERKLVAHRIVGLARVVALASDALDTGRDRGRQRAQKEKHRADSCAGQGENCISDALFSLPTSLPCASGSHYYLIKGLGTFQFISMRNFFSIEVPNVISRFLSWIFASVFYGSVGLDGHTFASVFCG
jgi:hypothetical protein